MGPFGEAVARIADQPPSFRGRYLENHDLEDLGFLDRACLTTRRRSGDLRVMAIEQFPIEAGHVLMFARAIGDPNPDLRRRRRRGRFRGGGDPRAAHVRDRQRPVRPRLPAAPEARAAVVRVRPRGHRREADRAVGRESEDGGGGGTSLHAEQHYEYHRPLVVGDVLHARGRNGETVGEAGRSGTLKFTELITEYLDASDEVVITARTVAVLTEGPK